MLRWLLIPTLTDGGMMTSLKLLKPGSEVETITGKKVIVADAMVTGEEMLIQYRIVIWSGDERKEAWVHANEIAQNIDDPVINVELQ